jgi:hypothetical protein
MRYCSTANGNKKKMELHNLIYSILPSDKREQLINKKNVKVINKFLKERKKLQTAKDDDIARLRQLRRDRSINTSMYHRLKHVMIITHEQKRIELIESITKKTAKNGTSVKIPNVQLSEDDQIQELDVQSINQASEE